MPRCLYLVILVCFGLVACASAESPGPNLPAFAHLRSQAIHSADVDIDIGGLPLGLAGWLSDDHDSDMAAVRSALAGLRSVHVRHYEFGSDFAYSKADVDAVRDELSGPGWSRIAHVLDQKEGEDVDIYLAVDQTRIKGLAIVASAPREFTFINTIGSLDLAQVAALRRHLGTRDDAAHDAPGGNPQRPLLPF
jgi:hypothetical protein